MCSYEAEKRLRAYVSYKVISDGLLQEVPGCDLYDYSSWPVEKRLSYERQLIRGYIKNKRCYEGRILFRDTYIPPEQQDVKHEAAIMAAGHLMALYGNLLCRLVQAIRADARGDMEIKQQSAKLLATMFAETEADIAQDIAAQCENVIQQQIDKLYACGSCGFASDQGVPFTALQPHPHLSSPGLSTSGAGSGIHDWIRTIFSSFDVTVSTCMNQHPW